MANNPSSVSHFESLYPADTRFAEIDKMLDFLRHGHSCQTVGLPGSGQSTFLKLLTYNKSVRMKHLGDDYGKFHFVMVNFSEIRKRPLIDAMKLMFLSLVESLSERQLHDEHDRVYSIFKESLNINDELVLLQGLKNAINILTLEKNFSIIFLLDRFEEYIPSLTAEFFSNMRALRNQAKYKFGAVFSLNRPLEDSVEPVLMADYFDLLAGHIVYLPLKDEPGLNFRIKHLEELSGKTIAPGLKREILNLTGGMGRLTKNCIEHAINNITGYNSASGYAIEQLNNELSTILLSQPSIRAPLNEIWQALTPSEQDFLTGSSTYATSDQDYPYLSNVGLLHEGQITIPLLQIFIEQTLKPAELREMDTISIDPNTNEIKQGNTVISDRLTSSEYKLLSFLLSRGGPVVDRESIINAVWKEAVSTAGVTDQALDQLIFRVRRKIEDDPNNPQHILTIKGRGFKFQP